MGQGIFGPLSYDKDMALNNMFDMGEGEYRSIKLEYGY